MPATCPTCSWPDPTLVSAHGTVRYLRCVCGQWIIEDHATVIATAGESAFAAAPADSAPSAHHRARSARLTVRRLYGLRKDG